MKHLMMCGLLFGCCMFSIHAYQNFSKEELVDMVGILLQQNTHLKHELKKANVELPEKHAVHRLEKELEKFNREISLK